MSKSTMKAAKQMIEDLGGVVTSATDPAGIAAEATRQLDRWRKRAKRLRANRNYWRNLARHSQEECTQARYDKMQLRLEHDRMVQGVAELVSVCEAATAKLYDWEWQYPGSVDAYNILREGLSQVRKKYGPQANGAVGEDDPACVKIL